MVDDKFFENKIRTVNGIMCVLVVFLHSYNIERYSNLNCQITLLLEAFVSKTLGNLAVPTFFFMSAILFFKNYSWAKMWSKYRSRISSIVVPYILWNIIYLMIFLMLVNFPLSKQFMDTKEIVINSKVLIDSVFFHQYNGVYWFMYQLILFIFISPAIYLLMKTRYGFFFIPVLFIISYWVPTIPSCSNGVIVNYLVYWVVGAYFALHKRETIHHRCSNSKLYLLLSIILIVVRFYLEFINRKLEVNNYIFNLLLLSNVLLAWFALDVLKFNTDYKWMHTSFFIYTVHPLIVWTIKNSMFMLLLDSDVMALLNYIISGMGGVVISVCVAKMMMHFSPKLFSILCGKR